MWEGLSLVLVCKKSNSGSQNRKKGATLNHVEKGKNGVKPSQVDMFDKTHKKDGVYVNDKAREFRVSYVFVTNNKLFSSRTTIMFCPVLQFMVLFSPIFTILLLEVFERGSAVIYQFFDWCY